MSPVPVIELQRRLTIVGAIRAGGEKQPNRPGAKLQAWRITSPRRDLVEQAGSLYGGSVSPWESPSGKEWQVYTESEEIPALVMPGYSLRQSYELWEGATKRLRVCDGLDEAISGGACICNAENRDVCDLYTRLVVALPELDSVHGWQLISRGANAAHELPTMMALIEAKAQGQTFVPARLRLDQRRGVKEGQVVRFVVPTIDLGVGYLALAATPDDGRALPSGSYVPAPPRAATLEQAMGVAADSPTSTPSEGRGAVAAFGPVYDPEETPPIPVEDPDAPLPPPPSPPVSAPPADETTYEEERQTKALTAPQAKKLNVLVGKLRDGGHIDTESLWVALAKLRSFNVEQMIELLGGRDEAGQLHWAPLRESLTRPEAVQLIDWLEIKQKRVEAVAAQDGPVPYNELPPGY